MAPTTDSVIKLKVNGEVYAIDMDDLELGEIGVVEELCGKSISEIDLFGARGLQGLLWIAMHRKNPMVTLEDVGRVKFSQIEDADEPDEKEPAGKKKPRPTKPA